MPIAVATLASVAFASSLAAAAPSAASFPPIVVDVTVASNVPATLVTRVLDEADAIWRSTGLTVVWRRHPTDASSPATADPMWPIRQTLDVTIGDERGAAPKGPENTTTLGWITFVEPDVPGHEIHVSYANAVVYLTEARGVVGLVDRMTIIEREMKLARAMGRALAHEMGHYLLGSKAHTPTGLMEAAHTASEFFNYERNAFAITTDQRQTVADRLRQAPLVASW